MENVIKLKIETLSNLFIGGAPLPFEIGGIDQQTVTDPEGSPYIPGSSIKGALRVMVKGNSDDPQNEISQRYADYLKKNREKNREFIREMLDKENAAEKVEVQERINDKYEKALEKTSAEYLFGIEGFNNTPKLLFSDLQLCGKHSRDKEDCFSFDMKNAIDDKGAAPVSNPRSYRTARRGLVFEGEIRLYKMEALGGNAEELCKRYVKATLMKFNEGIYRLGNSKSRGYGRIKVTIEDGSEG